MANAPALVLSPNIPSAVALDFFGGLASDGPYIRADEASLTLPFVEYDEDYAESPDTEGGVRVRSRAQRTTGHVDFYVRGSTTAIMWQQFQLIEQTVEACRRRGGTLTYTPRDQGSANAVTYTVTSARISDAQQQDELIKQGRMAGSVEFQFEPYGALPQQTSYPLSDVDPFNRDTITNQEWRFDAGAGTVSATGGVLVPSTTANKRPYRPFNVADATAYVKVTTGASLAGFLFGPVLKRFDGNNAILGIIEGAANLSVYKLDNGVLTRLATGAVTFNTATTYWLKLAITGNAIVLTAYTTDPNGSNPTSAYGGGGTVTLTGGDATKFGTGVKGSPGLWWTPNNTTERVDDWRVDSAWMETYDPQANFELLGVGGSAESLIQVTATDRAGQQRKHVEIGLDDRDYDRLAPLPTLVDSDSMQTIGNNVAGQTRPGTNEVQTITITGTPTGGTWTPAWNGIAATSTVAFNAAAATLQTALNTIPGLNGNVTVGGGPGPGTPYTVTFSGQLAATDVPLIAVQANALTGGSTPAVGIVETTRGLSGAYDPNASGNSVLRATLGTSGQGFASTGLQLHNGNRKIKLRCFPNAPVAPGGPVYVRLAWRSGSDGGWSRKDWVAIPNMGNWYELDLGTIQIPDDSIAWEGKIEAYSGTQGDTLDIDYVQILPARRWGRAKATADIGVQSFLMQDRFSQAGTLAGLVIGGVSAQQFQQRQAGAVADNGGGSIGWFNPSLASGVFDGVYANAFMNYGVGNQVANYLCGKNFGFSIPSGGTATINGIYLEMVRYATFNTDWSDGSTYSWYAHVILPNLFLTRDAANAVGSNYGDNNWWGSSAYDFAFGGAADLWGTTWTPAQINAATFGVLAQPNIWNLLAPAGDPSDLSWYVASQGGYPYNGDPPPYVAGAGNRSAQLFQSAWIDGFRLTVYYTDTTGTGDKWTIITGSSATGYTATSGVAQRTAVSDTNINTGSYISAGGGSFDNIGVAVTVAKSDQASVAAEAFRGGAFARLVDVNNYLLAVYDIDLSTTPQTQNVRVFKRVGGTVTQLGTAVFYGSLSGGRRLWLEVDTAGNYFVWAGSASQPTLVLTGNDPVLATGGALATGKVGIYDAKTGSTATTRSYDDFEVWIPEFPAGPITLGSGFVVNDSTRYRLGTHSVPQYNGAYMKAAPAGREGRGIQVVGKARRNDVDLLPDSQIYDPTRWAVDVTPRVAVL